MIPFQKDYYLYTEEKKLLYCSIPKNACTSIKAWLQGLLGLPADVDPQLDPNITRLMLGNYPDEYASEIMHSDDIFKFVFVRNPWNRVVSAFINKFLSYQQHLYLYTHDRNNHGIAEFHANYHEEFVATIIGTICTDDASKARGISFRDFLDYLLATDDYDLDPHWKPQYRFIEGVDIDYVGKLESMEEDFKRIQEITGHSLRLPFRNITEYNPSNVAKLIDTPCSELIGMTFSHHNFYDRTTVEAVNSRYKQDIDTFNYTYN